MDIRDYLSWSELEDWKKYTIIGAIWGLFSAILHSFLGSSITQYAPFAFITLPTFIVDTFILSPLFDIAIAIFGVFGIVSGYGLILYIGMWYMSSTLLGILLVTLLGYLSKLKFNYTKHKKYIGVALLLIAVLATGMFIGKFGPFAATQIWCYDSDGGKNYYLKGEVRLGAQTFVDHCSDTNTLVEFYCLPDGTVGSEYMACPDSDIFGVKCQGSLIPNQDDGKCVGPLHEQDISIAAVVSAPTTLQAGQESEITLRFRNNAPYTATRTIEVCIYPRTWKGQVYTAVPFASWNWDFIACCPENWFCEGAILTLEPYEEVVETFYPYAPNVGDYDACHNQGSAWDGNGDKYDIVAGIIKSCYDPNIPGTGGFTKTPTIRPLTIIGGTTTTTIPGTTTTTLPGQCTPTGCGVDCQNNCLLQYQQGVCDLNGWVTCVNACLPCGATTTTLPTSNVIEYASPIISVSDNSVTAQISLRNIGNSMTTHNIIEMQVRPSGQPPLQAIIGEQRTCDASHPENVHRSFFLDAGDSSTITLSSTVPSGLYDIYLISVDKCWMTPPQGNVNVQPYNGVKYIQSISVSGTTTSTTLPTCTHGQTQVCTTQTGQMGVRTCVNGQWGVCIVQEVCNNNNVCEPNLGEDFGSCPNDCSPPLYVWLLGLGIISVIGYVIYVKKYKTQPPKNARRRKK